MGDLSRATFRSVGIWAPILTVSFFLKAQHYYELKLTFNHLKFSTIY